MSNSKNHKTIVLRTRTVQINYRVVYIQIEYDSDEPPILCESDA